MSNKCKYYTGAIASKCCKADVNYRELVGGIDVGWLRRLPCVHTSLRKNQVICNQFVEMTDQDIEEEKKELDKLEKASVKVISNIRKLDKSYGLIDCPLCNGTIQFSVRSNGHVHAHCLNEGCLSIME